MRVMSLADIGARIRLRRLELGLGQQELADRVGVSRQWIVGLEGGRTRADAGLVVRTIEALGLGIFLEAASAPSRVQFPNVPDVDLDMLIERSRGRHP